MRTIENTPIEGFSHTYGACSRALEELDFALGGNWDYDHGSFDRKMADQGGDQVYLRLPFHVVEGKLDQQEAVLVFDTPYVLRHVVQTDTETYADGPRNPMLNQFQEPVETDGHVEEEWLEQGRELVEQAARALQEEKQTF